MTHKYFLENMYDKTKKMLYISSLKFLFWLISSKSGGHDSPNHKSNLFYLYGLLNPESDRVSTFFCILGFVRHMTSVTTIQLCHCSAKAAIDNM